MNNSKLFMKILTVLILSGVLLSCVACSNSAFKNDAIMQSTVRGTYASLDDININGGRFVIVEDDSVCEISVFNTLLGQNSNPIYSILPVTSTIKKRDYKKGRIVTETKTYQCTDIDDIYLTANLNCDNYNYTQIQSSGNILLGNSEYFSVSNLSIKNSAFNTKIFSGNIFSKISTKAILLEVTFSDEQYNNSVIKYFYQFQISKNSINKFEVEIPNNVDTSRYRIFAYYI